MRIRELFRTGGRRIYIAVTNEESKFIRRHTGQIIELTDLEPRDSRIAENLIFKDILCKINHKQAMVKENVFIKTQ